MKYSFMYKERLVAMYHEVGIYTILLLYTNRQVVMIQEGGCIIMFQDRLVAIYL